MRWLLRLVDVVRIDHFRGFEAFWEIPARCKTAVRGRWVKGPGVDLFQALQKELGTMPILAEDLGVITPEVTRLKDAFFLPGMVVLPFSIWSDGDEIHFPSPCPNSFYYSGTHDNDTLQGWLKELHKTDRSLYGIVAEYAGFSAGTSPRRLVMPLITEVMKSDARIAIIPMQDWLGLDSSARMNQPATCVNNWSWRLSGDELTSALAEKMKRIVRKTRRL